MNFIFSDGTNTGLPITSRHVEVKFPNFDHVRLIKMNGCANSELNGLEFFNEHNKSLGHLGSMNGTMTIEIPIAEGERIIGVKSKRRHRDTCRQDDV